MAVLPKYRGQGIGRRLLDACLAKAKSKGITRVELEVRIDNSQAIKLYEKAGFSREGVKKNALFFDEAYYDALLMSLIASS
jgi:ribosomal protein S18 acetylase RimI-like enzyme